MALRRFPGKIKHDQPFFSIQFAGIGINIWIVIIQQNIPAIHKERIISAEFSDAAEIIQDRLGILFLRFGVYLFIVPVDGYPRCAVRESRVGFIIPLEWGTPVVAALKLQALHERLQVTAFAFKGLVLVHGRHVPVVLDLLKTGIGHAPFIAVIIIGGAAHGHD